MDMEGFELVSLLCSRLCHDLVSPVGAVTNGLEVLADETEAELREMAMRLITQSADRAANKLQFARLAYGSSGGPGGMIDMGEAKKVILAVLEDHKVALEWQCHSGPVSRMSAKLLVNATFLAAEALPRGGKVIASLSIAGGITNLEIAANGPRIMPIEGMLEILSGDKSVSELAPRAAQAYYTGLIARLMGAELRALLGSGQLSLKSRFAG